MLSSQPIKVSQPKLVLGNYPPSPDTVASKSVPGPDLAQEPVSGSWSLVDSFRCCALFCPALEPAVCFHAGWHMCASGWVTEEVMQALSCACEHTGYACFLEELQHHGMASPSTQRQLQLDIEVMWLMS